MGASPKAFSGIQGSSLLDREAEKSHLGSNHFKLDGSLSPVLTLSSGSRRDGVRHTGSQGWGSALEESVTPPPWEVLKGRRDVLGTTHPCVSGSAASSARLSSEGPNSLSSILATPGQSRGPGLREEGQVSSSPKPSSAGSLL